jgi:hypothetical protein
MFVDLVTKRRREDSLKLQLTAVFFNECLYYNCYVGRRKNPSAGLDVLEASRNTHQPGIEYVSVHTDIQYFFDVLSN